MWPGLFSSFLQLILVHFTQSKCSTLLYVLETWCNSCGDCCRSRCLLPSSGSFYNNTFQSFLKPQVQVKPCLVRMFIGGFLQILSQKPDVTLCQKERFFLFFFGEIIIFGKIIIQPSLTIFFSLCSL